jgi:AraC family transcriptional regulator
MERSDEFFGRSVTATRAGAFDLSITDYVAGAALDWHGHAGPYLTYVARGGYCEMLRSARTRECANGHLVPHAADEVHANEFRAATRCINIRPDAAWLARWNMTFDVHEPVVCRQAASIMTRIRMELRRDDALSPMVIEASILELIAAFMRGEGRSDAPLWLRHVRSRILSRFREPLTIADLAESAGTHPVHLARSFRRHFGCTIGELMRHLRVDFAKRRIRDGLALSEVAAEAGFADQSHLTRTFRAMTGLTPGEFRRCQSVPRS